MKNTIEATLEQKQAIAKFLQLSEKLKNSYFWANMGNAANRRKMENNLSFFYSDSVFVLEISVSVSCKNVYVRKNVEITGKKTTATALKKFVK